MLYNHNQLDKVLDKKVMKKVKKQWVVVSLATFMFLGGASFTLTSNKVSADSNSVTSESQSATTSSAVSSSAVNLTNSSAAESTAPSSAVNRSAENSTNSSAAKSTAPSSVTSSVAESAAPSSATSSASSASNDKKTAVANENIVELGQTNNPQKSSSDASESNAKQITDRVGSTSQIKKPTIDEVNNSINKVVNEAKQSSWQNDSGYSTTNTEVKTSKNHAEATINLAKYYPGDTKGLFTLNFLTITTDNNAGNATGKKLSDLGFTSADDLKNLIVTYPNGNTYRPSKIYMRDNQLKYVQDITKAVQFVIPLKDGPVDSIGDPVKSAIIDGIGVDDGVNKGISVNSGLIKYSFSFDVDPNSSINLSKLTYGNAYTRDIAQVLKTYFIDQNTGNQISNVLIQGQGKYSGESVISESRDLSSQGYYKTGNYFKYNMLKTTDLDSAALSSVGNKFILSGSKYGFFNFYDNSSYVNVKYQDQNGNEISASDLLTGKSGASYSTTAKQIPGYRLVKVPANANGNYANPSDANTPGNIDVTYIYAPDVTPVSPVAIDGKTGKEIPGVNIPAINVPGDHKPGDQVEIPTKDLPNIDGYNKPGENTVTVTIGDNGKVEVPYKQKETPVVPVAIDGKTGKEIPGVNIPAINVPGDHKPGDQVEIPTKDLPNIDGYNKPGENTVTVTIGDNGKVEVPYKQKETPLNPVAVDGKTGKEISGVNIPEIKVPGNHKKGDQVNIPTSELPEVPGYNKPTGSEVTVTIGDNGKVEVPYKQKETPLNPVAIDGKTGKEISGVNIPEIKVPGDHKKGEQVNIPTDKLPDIDGYNKPTGTEVTVTIGDNGKVEVPYKQKETPVVPVAIDGKTGKEISGVNIPEIKVPGDHKKGEQVNIPTDKLPDIDGYNKPTGSEVTVTIGDNGKVEVPYKQKETPLNPVAVDGKTGKEISGVNIPEIKVPGDHKKGEQVNIPTDKLPDIDGYNKPTGTEVTVTIGDNGKVEVPYKQKETPVVPVAIDGKTGKEIPGVNIPAINVPGDHKPGDQVEIPTKDLPNIDGYNKPGENTVTVTIGDNGKVEVPYKQKETPVVPVAIDGKTGKEISGVNIPAINVPGDHKKGDQVNIPTSELPEVPGYNKPTGSEVTVTIGDNGKVEVPYKQKETPLNPVAVDGKTGKEISGVNIPEIKVPGDYKKGEQVNIPTSELPEVPGYNKPTGSEVTVTIGDNGKVEVPYKQKETPLKPVAIDQDTKQPINGVNIPSITVKGDHKKGDQVNIPTSELPEVPGYNKPTGSEVTVTIGDNGKVEVPYKQKETPLNPVAIDQDTHKPIDGANIPSITVKGDHKKGDQVNIPTSELPEVQGYNKPTGSEVTVTIGDNGKVEVPYKQKETPLNPVAIDQDTHKPIDGANIPSITVKGDHKKGDSVNIPTSELPEVPGYNKPTGSEVTVTIGDNGKVEVPYKQKETPLNPVAIDQDTHKPIDGANIPSITVKGDHHNGDQVNIPTKDLPEVPGYNKPTGSEVTVTIGDNGKVEVPYKQKETTVTPSAKDAKTGKDIPGVNIPEITIPGDHHKGDQVNIPTKDLPEVPGYNKPTGSEVTVTIGDNGKVEIPYTSKETPVVPVAIDGKTGKEIQGVNIPTINVPGEHKKGDQVNIPTSELPEVLGYNKPTGSEVTVTIGDNGKVNVPYVAKETNTTGNNSSNNGKQQKVLPQTGETNSSSVFSLIGISLLSMFGLLGLGKRRKNEK
ncbi:MucBP domain-containing protein [Fructilactobacillus vespulae]|uniref:DUF5978 domain-containing protein n=1 Tax=Fructilactobacillus vespulae TaxID=1249630 RepID=UPI0039B3F20B